MREKRIIKEIMAIFLMVGPGTYRAWYIFSGKRYKK